MTRWTFAALAAAAGLTPLAWVAGIHSAQGIGRSTLPDTAGPEPAPAATPRTAQPASRAPASLSPATHRAQPSRRSKLDQTPDLTQTDPELGLPGGGNSYCGPVAVSNSLMWLASQGWDRLAPPGDNPKEQQIELVRRLSSNRYMSTSPSMGTGATGILSGLDRYLSHRGCPYRRLAYQGWRGHPLRFSTGVRTPELEFIQEGILGRGLVWINVGWYRRGRHRRTFRRRGGHWLTVVGAGVNENGKQDPTMLILHDPAPYAGEDFANEYVRAEPLEGGWLTERKAAVPAQGYYRLTGGMHVKREGDLAILDGAVVLQI